MNEQLPDIKKTYEMINHVISQMQVILRQLNKLEVGTGLIAIKQDVPLHDINLESGSNLSVRVLINTKISYLEELESKKKMLEKLMKNANQYFYTMKGKLDEEVSYAFDI